MDSPSLQKCYLTMWETRIDRFLHWCRLKISIEVKLHINLWGITSSLYSSQAIIDQVKVPCLSNKLAIFKVSIKRDVEQHQASGIKVCQLSRRSNLSKGKERLISNWLNLKISMSKIKRKVADLYSKKITTCKLSFNLKKFKI